MGQKSKQKLERRIQQGREPTLPPDAPWTPFLRAIGPDGQHTITEDRYQFAIFRNSRYTVLVREFQSGPDYPVMVHLSIKRNDRKPVTSWRDCQKIKNELVGPECEGVQMFPAESRLVDNANQYHLFVCKDPEIRMPFGYQERLVSEGNIQGSVQEPFEVHTRPPDLTDRDLIDQRMTEYKARMNLSPRS